MDKLEDITSEMLGTAKENVTALKILLKCDVYGYSKDLTLKNMFSWEKYTFLQRRKMSM